MEFDFDVVLKCTRLLRSCPSCGMSTEQYFMIQFVESTRQVEHCKGGNWILEDKNYHVLGLGLQSPGLVLGFEIPGLG